MKVNFEKYHGTGNDFILIDNRNGLLKEDSHALYRSWCDRHFGVGADGIILLQNHGEADFEMVYFNSDGNKSSMCGNGGRCAVQFAYAIGMCSSEVRFLAADGMHTANIQPDQSISLGMKEVNQITEWKKDHLVLDTGSPHLVIFVPDAKAIDLLADAPKLRYHSDFSPGGLNVNYAEALSPSQYFVRTYERGVEGETLSCGTGMVATAIAAHFRSNDQAADSRTELVTPGGKTSVSFSFNSKVYSNVVLTGPAVHVFGGTLEF